VSKRSRTAEGLARDRVEEPRAGRTKDQRRIDCEAIPIGQRRQGIDRQNDRDRLAASAVTSDQLLRLLAWLRVRMRKLPALEVEPHHLTYSARCGTQGARTAPLGVVRVGNDRLGYGKSIENRSEIAA